MNTELKYKTFEYDKSAEELAYNSSIWTSDLNFIDLELQFLKKLIKSYPFKSTIPNLYENLELFLGKINEIETTKNNISEKVFDYINQLGGMEECDDIICDNYYVVEFEKLAEEIFNLTLNYKQLKSKIYEYLSSIIST